MKKAPPLLFRVIFLSARRCAKQIFVLSELAFCTCCCVMAALSLVGTVLPLKVDKCWHAANSYTHKHPPARKRAMRWGERKVNGGSAYKGQDLCATPPSRNELCGDVGRDRARHTQIAIYAKERENEMPLAPPPPQRRSIYAACRNLVVRRESESTNRSLFAPRASGAVTPGTDTQPPSAPLPHDKSLLLRGCKNRCTQPTNA